MNDDEKRFLVIAKSGGRTRGTLVVYGARNIPEAKVQLALAHLGSDEIREVAIGPGFRPPVQGVASENRKGWAV